MTLLMKKAAKVLIARLLVKNACYAERVLFGIIS